MPNQKSKIAIIIIGLNELHHLKLCLPSIAKSTYRNYKIYFVDNKSSDGTVQYLKKHFPTIRIIQNRANLGFSKANNIGLKQALRDGFEYVLVLNPDTILDRHCLEILAKNVNPDTIAQPLVLLYRKRKLDLVNTSGNHLHFLGFSYCSDYKKNKRSLTRQRAIAGASGAAMLVSKKIIKKIGYFDEIISPYHEDLDLSWRARLNGFEIKLVPQAILWHQYEFLRNKKKFFYVERNRLLFMLKNYQWKTLLVILPAAIVVESAVIIYALANGWLWGKIKSYGSFLLAAPKIVRKRKTIEKLRTKTDRQLAEYLSGRLSFGEVQIPASAVVNSISNLYWQVAKNLI